MQVIGTNPFSGLLGQQRAKTLLAKSLQSGRIAHAYLFRGPAGVGKKLFAAAMAKALNCRTSGPAGACGQCPSCRKYLSGNHPDYLVESPEKEAIKIEQIRQLTKNLTYAPYESEYRVVVLEDVHKMRQEAANSLLKTLEEPPEGNVLILTAETSKNVLATISSRCQVVSFFPLKMADTAKILSEQHGVDAEQSMILARLAEGSPGKALLLNETDMLETWKGLTAVLDEPKYQQPQHCPMLLQWAQKMADLKENLVPLLGLLRVWLRDMLEKNENAGQVGGENRPTVSSGVFTGLEAVDRAEKELARNCNRALVCEILLFRLQLSLINDLKR